MANGSSFDFGLGGLTQAISASANALREKQVEEQKNLAAEDQMNQKLAEIADRQAGVSQQLVESLKPVLKTVGDAEKGRVEQETLRGSGDPLDFLTAIGNEIVDPGKYTQAGRSKRVAEATQQMNVLTSVAGIQQAQMADLGTATKMQFEAGQGKLKTATLTAQQQNELLQAEVTKVATQASVLANQTSMQQTALMQMSTEQLKALSTKANGQPIDVGGVMIQPGILQERITAVDERDFINENRALARQAGRMDLDAKLAKKELQLMSLEELRPLMLSGSEKYDSGDIAAEYKIKQDAMTAKVDSDSKMFQYKDWGSSVLAPAIQDLDRIMPNIPQGSPLESAANGYKSMIVGVTNSLSAYKDRGEDIPVEVIDSANKTMTVAKEAFYKRLDDEAKFKAKGDKDMQDIYMETFRGNQPPQASVESAIQNRLKKNAPLSDVLPDKEAKRISALYNEKYQGIKKQNMLNGDLKDDDIKQMAIQAAMEQGIKESLTDRNTSLMASQVDVQGHPLAGRLGKEQMLNLQATADQRGLKNFQQSYGLSDEELDTFLQGNPVPGKVTLADAAILTRIQTQELMMDLDARESGLGQKYADWWLKSGASYVKVNQQSRGDGGLQSQVLNGFTNKVESEQMGAYMMVIAGAAEDYDGKKAERYQNMVSFDLNPSHKQAALLQFDDTLTDGERQQFMKGFILPIVSEAQKAGKSYEETNTLIEQAIDSNMSPDPGIAKIMKKVVANRPKIVNNLESVMGQTFWRAGPNQPRMGFQPNAWLRRTVAQRSYAWYEQLMQEGNK